MYIYLLYFLKKTYLFLYLATILFHFNTICTHSRFEKYVAKFRQTNNNHLNCINRKLLIKYRYLLKNSFQKQTDSFII